MSVLARWRCQNFRNCCRSVLRSAFR